MALDPAIVNALLVVATLAVNTGLLLQVLNHRSRRLRGEGPIVEYVRRDD